jgi:signal peptidase II
MSRTWRWFALAAAVVVADQLTKWAIVGYFTDKAGRGLAELLYRGDAKERVSEFFNLVLVCNKGVAFSMFTGAPPWLFTAFSMIAVVVCAVLIVRHAGNRLFCAGLGLIIGGALGNAIDRVRLGCVVDFLDLYLVETWRHWPAFNVADSAICVGAALIVLEGFVHGDRRVRAPS